LVCFGGGFGTMSAFAADYFGSKNVGPIYGLMLTAWGFAGAFGPLLIARMRQAGGNYRGALHAIAPWWLFPCRFPLWCTRLRERSSLSSWHRVKGTGDQLPSSNSSRDYLGRYS
jgi:OFA family oxalate/formate antiporter-like MFS transporter